MFIAAVILAVILGYSTVAPDRRTLTLTRGLRGAVRAVANDGKSSKSSKSRRSFLRGADRRPRPAPSRKSKKFAGAKSFRGLASMIKTARAGWRQGVDEALALRESGDDLCSRLGRGPVGRGARRTVQAGGRAWGSVREWWKDRRATRTDGDMAETAGEHRARAADRAHRAAGGDRDTGVVFGTDQFGNRAWPDDPGADESTGDGGEVIELGPNDWADRTTQTPPPEWVEASERVRDRLTGQTTDVQGHDAWMDLFQDMTNRNGNATHINERKGKTMQTTDLENLDAVRTEAAAAREAATVMAEQLADMQSWAASLTDRWSGTPWATSGLNSAIAGVADSVPQIDPDELLSALAAVDEAANEAATVAEVADQVGAEGDLAAFRAS